MKTKQRMQNKASKDYKYMVMKLVTHVELYGQNVKLGGCAGYIPVYNSAKEAMKIAGDKYKIQVIEAIEK